MLRANVENCLILVIAQLEVFLGTVEVLFEHGHIVVLQSVIQRQITIVIDDIRPRANLINDRQLFLHADDVLNSLTPVVLHATGLEKLIVSTEPVEDVLITISRTFKQRVFSKVVTFLQCLILILSVVILAEKFKHLQILHLSCKEDRIVSFEVWSQTLVFIQFEKFSCKCMILLSYSHMKR